MNPGDSTREKLSDIWCECMMTDDGGIGVRNENGAIEFGKSRKDKIFLVKVFVGHDENRNDSVVLNAQWAVERLLDSLEVPRIGRIGGRVHNAHVGGISLVSEIPDGAFSNTLLLVFIERVHQDMAVCALPPQIRTVLPNDFSRYPAFVKEPRRGDAISSNERVINFARDLAVDEALCAIVVDGDFTHVPSNVLDLVAGGERRRSEFANNFSECSTITQTSCHKSHYTFDSKSINRDIIVEWNTAIGFHK